MATPGELFSAISECFGIAETTVFQHDRELVKAGFRRAGARGRNASVAPVDAANLLIAIFGSSPFGPSIKDSVKTLENYRALPARVPDNILAAGAWQHAMPSLPAGHNFQTALAELIEGFAAGNFNSASQIWPRLRQVVSLEEQSTRLPTMKPMPNLLDLGQLTITVTITGPIPEASIEIEGTTFGTHPDRCSERLRYIQVPKSSKASKKSDWYQMRAFGEKPLRKISAIFREKPIAITRHPQATSQ